MKKHTIAIVLAAGQGKRMNSTVRKQYLLIQEKPVLYYTLKAFEESFIDEILLVVGDGEEQYCKENIVDKYHFFKVAYMAAMETHACIVGVPVKDTIKVVGKDGVVQHTPERASLYIVQTPQVFVFEKIKTAYDKLIEAEKDGKLEIAITDDAMVMETFTENQVCVVEGSYQNIKITTPDDMILAERILNAD